MKKIAIALCAIVLVIVAGVLPSFAETWAEESPVYETTNGVWVGYQGDAQYETLRLQVQDAVWKAYELGMFGGLYPVAVFYRTVADNAFIVQVMTPMGNTEGGLSAPGYFPANGSQKFNGYALSYFGSNGTQYADRLYLSNSQSTTTARQPFVMWTLRTSGDWTPSWTGSGSNYVPLSSTAWPTSTAGVTKLAVALNPNDNHLWFDYPVGSAYKTGWVSGGTITGNNLNSVISRYDEQLALLEYVPPDPVPPTVSYQLDIAEIFDGYFAGVRDTLGAFNINLFGINIIGVLIAFIVIAVVAFIVRKLWK